MTNKPSDRVKEIFKQQRKEGRKDYFTSEVEAILAYLDEQAEEKPGVCLQCRQNGVTSYSIRVKPCALHSASPKEKQETCDHIGDDVPAACIGAGRCGNPMPCKEHFKLGNDSTDFVNASTHPQPEKPWEKWLPTDHYWFIDEGGEIFKEGWNEDVIDFDRFNFGNCFPSAYAAQAASEKIRTLLASL